MSKIQFKQTQITSFSINNALTSISIILVGIFLFLLSKGYHINTLILMWPFLCIFIGLFIGFYFIINNYIFQLFLSLFFILTGITFTIAHFLNASSLILTYWPLLFTYAGISLITIGFAFSNRYTIAYIICGSFISIISGIFLLFTNNLVSLSFMTILTNWWPVGIIIMGFILFILNITRFTKQNISLQNLQDTVTNTEYLIDDEIFVSVESLHQDTNE